MQEPGVVIRHAQEILERYWRGRRAILLAHRVTTSTRKLADELARCGAVVAGVVAGAPPAAGLLPPQLPAWVPAPSARPLDRRAFDDMVRSPGAELADWVEAVDPDGTCLAIATIWGEVPEVLGRPVHGWRRPQWARLEDKTRVERIWADIGVPSPRHAVLTLDDPSLPERAAMLDGGRGVVLATDSSRGILGGGGGLRWVRHPGEFDAVLAEFAGLTEAVRIAEFVPGIPCSTQALLLDGGVAVFGPAEEVMLRSPGTGAFFYCGTSTWWRAEPSVSREIEGYVREAGRWLGEHAGFRGMFTVDGVITVDGFLATELNPRAGGGLGVRPGWPGFPIYLFQRAALEALPGIITLDPDDIEGAFVDAIRRCPSYSGTIALGPAGPALGGDGTFTASAGEFICYRTGEDGADVLQIRPTRGDRIIGPAMAELAAALGTPGLVSFADDTVCSTLRGGRQ
jgi:hypothetical protein